MNCEINQNSESIDRATSRSICDGVGERLQQNLRPERSKLPSNLQHLMDEMSRRDNPARKMSAN